jgi:hypothetical protein
MALDAAPTLLSDAVTAVAIYLPLDDVPSLLSVSSAWYDAVCHNELWSKIIQRQWVHVTPASFGVKFGGYRQICQAMCTLRPLQWQLPHDKLSHMSEPAQRFLFGIAHGYVPTADGLFTYHCHGAMPIHFRHCAEETPRLPVLGGQGLRVGGSWMWSPDRKTWFRTDTCTITQGRLVFERCELEPDNVHIIQFLQEWPLVPLVVSQMAVRCDTAITEHSNLNQGPIRDFIRAVSTGPEPAISCVATNTFTVHFLFLPALHLDCTEERWDIARSTRKHMLRGSLQAFDQLVSQLNRKRAGTDFVGVDGRPLPPLNSYVKQYGDWFRREQLRLSEEFN